jgi:predicted transcriptional regulator
MESVMTVTTSLKLPDALKATIAQVAALEGKSAHALMVDTLQAAMDDALAQQQFYADGEAAYQDTLQSNRVYRANDVKAFVLARANGDKPLPLKPVALDPSLPMLKA